MPEPPRVLRIVTRLNVGGPARQAIYLNRELPNRGFDCELVTGQESEREGRLRPDGGRVTLVPSLRRELNPRADLRAVRALNRLVPLRSPDIVHTHLAKAGALGRAVAHRAGVPYVIHTFHGHVLEGYFSDPVSRAFVATERRLARWSSALIAVSAAIRDQLLDLGIGRPSQWHVIPVGLELEELMTSRPDRSSARAALGLPTEGAVVGIVGRLVPVKDHASFLEAAARLAASRTDVTFVVVGDGELRQDLEARARAMLRERVRFTGWVSDLPALYSALDVVVLTSRNEGTPVALVEAGAALRPVVATRVGGVTDVVQDGVTGTLVPAGDPRAIAAAVDRLLDDESLRRSMGRAGRNWVRERFSDERLAGDLTALYEGLLGRTSRPAVPPASDRGRPAIVEPQT